MPLNTLSQIFNTTAIKAIPNQNNNLLDFVGVSGTTVASVTSGGVLDLRGSSGTILGDNSSVIGNKIQLWGNTYGIGIQGSRLVIYNDPVAATSIRTSLTGSDIIRFNSDGNISGRYIDSIANSGAYLDLGVGTSGIIAVNKNAAHIPLTIRGATSQSANLLTFQNSSETVLGGFGAGPGIPAGTGLYLGAGFIRSSYFYVDQSIVNAADNASYIAFNAPAANSGSIQVTSRNATHIPLTVRGFASQSANLQEWQDSAGAVLAHIDPDGKSYFTHSSTSTSPFGVEGTLRLRNRSATNNNYSLIEAESSGGGISSGIQFITSDHTNSYGKMIFGSRSAAGFNSSAFTVESGGGITTTLNTAASIGLVVKGAASQSGNLQEWQNSSGTVLMSVGPSGQIATTAGINATGSWANSLGGAGISGVILGVHTNGASNVGIVVRGSASQTGNLTEWQNSAGTGLSRVDSNGRLGLRTTVISSASLSVSTDSTTVVPAIIRGIASQTANLQEWQDSAGSVLAKVNSAGNLTAASFILSGGTFTVPTNGMYLENTNKIGFSTNTTNRMVIDSFGQVGIGTIFPQSMLNIVGDGVYGELTITRNSDSTGENLFRFNKSRGTKTVPTLVTSGDILANMFFTGYDGAAYQSSSAIYAEVDGTAAANSMPGRLTFRTTPSGSVTTIERMRILANGKIDINIPDGSFGSTIFADGQLSIVSDVSNRPGLVIQGRPAGQTASLQQWLHVAGYTVADMDIDGNLLLGSVAKYGGSSSEFLKADGSVDSTSYATPTELNAKADLIMSIMGAY